MGLNISDHFSYYIYYVSLKMYSLQNSSYKTYFGKHSPMSHIKMYKMYKNDIKMYLQYVGKLQLNVKNTLKKHLMLN